MCKLRCGLQSELLEPVLQGFSPCQEAIVLSRLLLRRRVPVEETIVQCTSFLWLGEHVQGLLVIFLFGERSSRATLVIAVIRRRSPGGIVSGVCSVAVKLSELVFVCIS